MVMAWWKKRRPVRVSPILIHGSFLFRFHRVLASFIEPLLSQGYHVVRYNSRGVGKSTGWASLTGISEGKDLEALVQWAIALISDIRDVVIFVSCSQ